MNLGLTSKGYFFVKVFLISQKITLKEETFAQEIFMSQKVHQIFEKILSRI